MTEPGEREVADTEEVETGIRRQAGQAPVSTSLLLSRPSPHLKVTISIGLLAALIDNAMMYTK